MKRRFGSDGGRCSVDDGTMLCTVKILFYAEGEKEHEGEDFYVPLEYQGPASYSQSTEKK